MTIRNAAGINVGLNMAEDKIKELEAENQRLMDEIRDLEWKIYRPLKEGEMTQEGDQVLGPEEDAKWVPVTGNYRLTPSALYPAHCQYRRPIVDELRKEMEGDYFYRKCVAGKESARSKRIKVLEAENKRLEEERDRYLEELVVAKNVIKSDESQIKNLIKRNDEMRDDCIRTAEQRDKLAERWRAR